MQKLAEPVSRYIDAVAKFCFRTGIGSVRTILTTQPAVAHHGMVRVANGKPVFCAVSVPEIDPLVA